MNLYISDLDGTLLNPQAELTEYTKDILNKLVASGEHFTVATARTLATVRQMLEGVAINAPIILMNGVCVYDLQKQHYIKVESIDSQISQELIAAVHRHNMPGFLYALEDDRLSTFYEKITTGQAQKFVEERIKKYGKVFTHVDDFNSCLDKNLIYYSISDTVDKIRPLYNDLDKISGLHVEIYRDVYFENSWYIEVCSPKASKYNAVKFLREKFGFTSITAFGDNFNDLSMFQASDHCYAVANARTEVKAAADKIIDSNIEDGVAGWLKAKHKL